MGGVAANSFNVKFVAQREILYIFCYTVRIFLGVVFASNNGVLP